VAKKTKKEIQRKPEERIRINFVPDRRFWIALAGSFVVLFVLFLLGLVSYWIYVTNFA